MNFHKFSFKIEWKYLNNQMHSFPPQVSKTIMNDTLSITRDPER